MPAPARIKEFRRAVRTHYHRHRRDFPWRRTRDPYRILVSEFMLQQTQVERAGKFYGPFLKKFPTPKALAAAPLSGVLRAWQGLGYNRRAKFLRAAAERIVKEHGGKVPRDEAALVALPGVGRNTAGAVLAFAFNERVVFIETNIRRAFIHHFFPHKREVSDAQLLPLIGQALDRKEPREWYYALMDYGASLGRDRSVVNPNRRASAYKRQSAYEGSTRQARARILKYLLQHRALRMAGGEKLAGLPLERFRRAAGELQKEGFIITHRGTLRLK